MNQILITNKVDFIKDIDTPYFQNKNYNYFKIFKIIFIISIIFIILGIIILIYNNLIRNKKANISNSLFNTFSISNLYSSSNSYNSIRITKEDTNNKNNFYVIGSIKIDKIGIYYPIVSNISDELLKISPCKFYGPNPNEVGNLCIAAHNYDDNRFFSKIKKLKNNDEIYIYDISGNFVKYYVYKVFETFYNDTSCTLQDTNGKKEITLVTCNNANGNRIIVKAREGT